MPRASFVEREYTGYSGNRVFPIDHIESHGKRTLSDFLETATMLISDQGRVAHRE